MVERFGYVFFIEYSAEQSAFMANLSGDYRYILKDLWHQTTTRRRGVGQRSFSLMDQQSISNIISSLHRYAPLFYNFQHVKLQTQHRFITSLSNLSQRRNPFQKHFETLTFIFYSRSLYSEENTDRWGTIVDAILSLRSRNSQIRLEKCDFVNLTDEVAGCILSRGSLDSANQKSMHFEVSLFN